MAPVTVVVTVCLPTNVTLGNLSYASTISESLLFCVLPWRHFSRNL